MGRFIDKGHVFSVLFSVMVLFFATIIGTGCSSDFTVSERPTRLQDVVKGEVSDEMLMSGSLALITFSNTPYVKYVEETIVELQTNYNGEASPLSLLVKIYQNADIESGLDYGKLAGVFYQYSKSFRKDNPFFNGELTVDMEGYNSRYLKDYDNKYDTKIAESLGYDDQINAEVILKAVAGTDYEKYYREAINAYSQLRLFPRITRNQIEILAYMSCGNADRTKEARDACDIVMSDVMGPLSKSYVKEHKKDFGEELPDPERLIKMTNQLLDGNLTENQKQELFELVNVINRVSDVEFGDLYLYEFKESIGSIF